MNATTTLKPAGSAPGGRSQHYEAEDRHKIPRAFHPESPEQLVNEEEDPKEEPRLTRALRLSLKRGKGPFVVRPERVHVLSIEGRLATYNQERWGGPPIFLMAKAGFFCLHSERLNKAGCAFDCGKEFRFTSPEQDPFERHYTLSPDCPYVRASGGHRVNPALTKKRLYHSMTSVHEFTRQPA